MTSFAGQLLLESVLVPAAVSGLIVFPTRWFDHRVFLVLVTATAFVVAIAASYVLVFDWPTSPALGARQKIFLVTLAGVLLGISHGLDRKRSFYLLAALSFIGPLWIGWPALMQGLPSTILLILPMALALWVIDRAMRARERTIELGLLLVITAAGLAWIALFARTLSITQLSLALASTLLAAMSAGRKPLPPILLMAGATMLSGLLSAILLYGEASFWAILILCATPVLPPLVGFIYQQTAWRSTLWPTLLIASSLALVAVAIAWIDAGLNSVYEGAQQDEAIVQTFVS